MNISCGTFYSPNELGNFIKKMFIAGLIIIILAIVIQWSLHGLNHSNGAEIRQCFAHGSGTVASIISPIDPNRSYYICEVEPEKFGVLVLQKLQDGTYREVTAFFNKGKNIDKVIEYVLTHAK